MKRIILCLSLFAFFGSQAQQINPVPDYVFSNKMSVGRNAVTDTAAYFSIGPRYGAIRGMMPPMVTDTANMSATKRNGLLIFSIQKNKYLYWDSVGSKWAEMAGTAGSAITGSGVAGYMPEFTTSTNLDTTRLYHSAGRFAIGSTTTTNGVFNVHGGQSYFDTSLKVGSQTLLADEGKNEVYVNTTSDAGAYALQVAGNSYSTGSNTSQSFIPTGTSVPTNGMYLRATNEIAFATNSTRRLTINADGYFGIGVVPAAWTSGLPAIIDIGSYGSMWWTGGYLGLSNNGFFGASGWTYTGSLQATKLEQVLGEYRFNVAPSGTAGNAITWTQAMTLTNNSELLLNTTTDAGAYALQVAGVIYTTNDAYLGASSGRLGVGTTTPAAKITSIQSGVVTATNSAFWASHDGSANPLDGIGIGTNGNSSYKWIQTYGGALSLNSAGNDVLIGTTTDAGTYALQVTGAIYNTTTITTGAPTSGSAKPWRLGEAATVSPTSPNRTIRVEIDGTVYYIHAKTTND